MRSFDHITARYVYDRLRDRRFVRRYPELPWITPEAIEILGRVRLTRDIRALEAGTGRSTIWFAQRVKSLIAIEHDNSWFEKVRQELDSACIHNVTLELWSASEDASGSIPYVDRVKQITDNSLGFALVDGVCRDEVALAAIPKIAPGGVLAIDDAHRYLPSDSRSPLSRSIEDAPAGRTWADFASAVDSWTATWTSSGVSAHSPYTRPAP